MIYEKKELGFRPSFRQIWLDKLTIRKAKEMTTLETIQEILNENLDIDPLPLPPTPRSSLSVSIRSTWLSSCEIENRFDIELGEAEGLDTVGKLVDYIDGLK